MSANNEHEHEHEHKHEVRIHIDRKPYQSPNPTTGAALWQWAERDHRRSRRLPLDRRERDVEDRRDEPRVRLDRHARGRLGNAAGGICDVHTRVRSADLRRGRTLFAECL